MNDREGLLIETLLPKDTNAYGNIFGGVIMSMMDKSAAVAGWRYSRKRVVTACAHRITFHTPVNVGEVVYCRSSIIHVGHSSMEVEVVVEAEMVAEGAKRRAASGIFTMVAVDEDGTPTPVPPWKPETDAELAKWREVEARRKQ